MSTKFFKILHKSKKSKARLGKIHTYHGTIITPSFVPCATKGTLKGILPSLLKEIKIQVAFVNTYHLVMSPGTSVIKKSGGIHAFSKLNIPLMSDSGGFQVFSLAENNRKKNTRRADVRGDEQPLVIKISKDGVTFRSTFKGETLIFTPEKSIEYQIDIGSDIMMAFDECTYYPATHKYAKEAMERTHKWLLRCIKKKKELKEKDYKRYLYGIIQGGTHKDLRNISSEFVSSQKTDGVAIGGVSVHETKKEMREQVKWASKYLPKEKPVHLLGVGQLDDILDLVAYGIDTFDCVEPTRLARVGKVFQKNKSNVLKTRSWNAIDIKNNDYRHDLSPLDKNCNCYVCTNFTKAYIHHLFKQKELIGYSLLTYHNLKFMEDFFERIREKIASDRL